MCTSDQLKEAVLKSGVKGGMFDFSELADCVHILNVFKIFGQQMTKIKIGEQDIQYKERKISKFDEILRLIATYCSVDTLKCLELQYYNTSRLKKRFVYASLPFLRCIEEFTITETDRSGSEHCVDYFVVIFKIQ